MDSIAEILELGDDAELCDQLFCKLFDRYHASITLGPDGELKAFNPMNAEKLSEIERVVVLVYDGLGILLNGGFSYLFSADYPGDPGYIYMAASFQKIGCVEAAAAFADALALFPDNSPPSNPKVRLKVYEALDEASRDAIDGRLFRAEHAVITALAAFIRKHRHEFLASA